MLSLLVWALVGIVGGVAYAAMAGYMTKMLVRVGTKPGTHPPRWMREVMGWLWPLTIVLSIVLNLLDVILWPFRRAYRAGLESKRNG